MSKGISPLVSLVSALLACPAGALFLFLAMLFAFLLPYVVDVFYDGHDASDSKNPVSHLVHFSTSFLYLNYTISIYNGQ